MEIASKKSDYIKSEVFALAWNGAVQHNGIYLAGTPDDIRQKIEKHAKKFLVDLVESKYKKKLNEEDHIRNIETVANNITREYSSCLQNKIFRIGTAQKLLNLLLKYYWCLGYIEMPPHCPIDKIVLDRARIHDVSWTRIATIAEYNAVIARVKEFAKGEPLSEWELSFWKIS